MKLASSSFSFHSLSAQVLLWTALPFTILLMVFVFSGVSSHQQSMRGLAMTENERLVNALAQLIASQRENHAWRNDMPTEAVQPNDLDVNTLLAIEHRDANGAVVLLDHAGNVLFGLGNLPTSNTLSNWPGVAEVLAGESGVLFTSDTMHGDVIAYTPVPNSDWSLIIREAWHSLTDPLLRIEQVMPFVLFTATTISLLALFFGLRYVVQPLREQYPVTVHLDEPPLPFSKVSVGDSPVSGPPDAAVTVVEFSDYLCPACRNAHETTKSIRETYAGKIRWIFKDYPLDSHKGARKLAEAAHCAGEQGQFWEYQDHLFSASGEIGPAKLKEFATQLGLDGERFMRCFESREYAARVDNDIKQAGESGVSSTPSFIINGRLKPGSLSPEDFKQIIDEELTKAGLTR